MPEKRKKKKEEIKGKSLPSIKRFFLSKIIIKESRAGERKSSARNVKVTAAEVIR
jgi:hypothetical protein